MDCLQGSKLAKHCSWSSRNSRAVQGLHKFKHGKKVVQSSKSLLWFGYINMNQYKLSEVVWVFAFFLHFSFSEYVLRLGSSGWCRYLAQDSPSPCRCKRLQEARRQDGKDSMTWCPWCPCHVWLDVLVMLSWVMLERTRWRLESWPSASLMARHLLIQVVLMSLDVTCI